MRDLRKGFVFFMDQEKKDIKRHQAIEKAMKLQQKTEDLDAPKQWFEDEQLFRPISEWTLQKNEWQDFDEGADKVQPAYTPQLLETTLGTRKAAQDENSEETDEEFDWFEPEIHTDETYFSFVNKNRKTFMPGDQVFYCYGNRTNKFLLLNYGFCFPGNKYDSYEFPLRLDVPVGEVFVPEIVDLDWKSRAIQLVRVKKDQICEVMCGFLRSVCKKSFFSAHDPSEHGPNKRILLTRPTNLMYEQYVYTYYLQIIQFVQDELNKVSTLE